MTAQELTMTIYEQRYQEQIVKGLQKKLKLWDLIWLLRPPLKLFLRRGIYEFP